MNESQGSLFEVDEPRGAFDRAEERGRKEPAPRAGKRLCSWPGCTVMVSARLWGCPQHWERLPKILRSKIWLTYRPGQEIDGQITDAYAAAFLRIQTWIVSHGGGK